MAAARRTFVLIFVALTIAAPTIPLIIAKYGNFLIGFAIGLAMAIVWMALVQVGANRYGRSFLWFLLTAPFGMFWPLLILRWMFGATKGDPHWMAP